ncbi:RloB family protein [Streptomyces sp. NPDC058595]|uniref:RloB family protein n=1 Tax=Streptomyces sp. NPDC058595 TaxID=3346550 RepID=UPI00365AF3A4
MASRTRGKDTTDRRHSSGKRQPTVWVFTEGSLTEPQYIDIVKGLRDRSIRLSVRIGNDERTHGGTKGPRNPTYSRKPLDIFDHAVAKLREEQRRAKHEKWPAPPRGTRWTTVWCLFDRDQHEGIDTIHKEAEEIDGLEIAYSHPCFELWRLLHCQDYTSSFGGVCGEATKKLPFVTPRMSKEQAKVVLPSQILKTNVDGFAKARDRAQRMNNRHPDHVEKSRRDPYTDVWRFVEQGLKVSDY